MLHRHSHSFIKALMLAGALLCGVAQATVLQGTFSGIAFDSRIDAQSPTPRDFDGETVTGTFYYDTTLLGQTVDTTPDSDWRIANPGAVELVFHAAGETVVFDSNRDDDGSSVIVARDLPQGQRLQLEPGYLDPYGGASLVLAGPLFDGLDATTAREGPIDLTHSYANFFAGRSFGASVLLSEVTFLPAVPEPQTWGLMGLGLAFIAWRVKAQGRAR